MKTEKGQQVTNVWQNQFNGEMIHTGIGIVFRVKFCNVTVCSASILKIIGTATSERPKTLAVTKNQLRIQ